MKHPFRPCVSPRLAVLPLTIGFLVLTAAQAGAGAYTTSAHGNSTTGVDRTFDANFTNYAIGNCGHCHEQHTSLAGTEPSPTSPAGPNNSLLFSPESELCLACHDGAPVTVDVNAQIIKTYRHPTATSTDPTYDGRHTTSKLEKTLSSVSFRALGRHAECADCHNPHQAKSAVHVNFGAGNTNGANNNTIATANPNSVLLGVWGVELSTNPSSWGQMSSATYTQTDPATTEYQICFKCHSYYGLGENSGVSATITGPSGDKITDQSMEFNNTNRSQHPVRLSSNTATNDPGPLNSTWMVATWNQTGTQTMYCSDCHGRDNETAGIPKGPHGSSLKFMLANPSLRRRWPVSSTGVLWSLNDIAQLPASDCITGTAPARNTSATVNGQLFCLNCHASFGTNPYTNVANWKSGVHTAAWGAGPSHHYDTCYNAGGSTNLHHVYCVSCHSAVPHGTRRSRLIVYGAGATADIPPYTYSYTYTGCTDCPLSVAALSGFKYNAGVWNKADCYSTVAGCGSAGQHNVAVPSPE